MPEFLDLTTVLAIHARQTEVFGGASGLRDRHLLESAVGQAELTYAYTGSLYEAAAQYCISVSGNHPFLDGNKRVAAACMLVFLHLNGIRPNITPEQLFDWTMQVATGQLDRPGLAKLLLSESEFPE
jgi:death-on-curing protein